jgi:hypothetical protein
MRIPRDRGADCDEGVARRFRRSRMQQAAPPFKEARASGRIERLDVEDTEARETDLLYALGSRGVCPVSGLAGSRTSSCVYRVTFLSVSEVPRPRAMLNPPCRPFASRSRVV